MGSVRGGDMAGSRRAGRVCCINAEGGQAQWRVIGISGRWEIKEN
jgi:hypothetical protein